MSNDKFMPGNRLKLNQELNHTLLVYLTFIPFSVLGTYSRLGIYKLSSYDPSYITPTSTIWSNIVACFMFGVFRYTHGVVTIDSYLLPALTTGFCGTFSSFSSFILELFQHSTNLALARIAYPNPGYGVMEFISVLLVQLLASGGAIVFGQTVAKNLLNHFSSHHAKLQRVLRICGKLARYACIPVIISQLVLAIVFDGSSRLWTVGALFGIVGAITRFELANHFNNGKCGWFPWGTFVANVSSTTMACVFFLLRYGLKDGQLLVNNKKASSMLQYLTLGFCGSLSTLSTFVYEGHNMPIMHASLYYSSSIAICYCISILIIGTYAWTHGILPTERLISV